MAAGVIAKESSRRYEDRHRLVYAAIQQITQEEPHG